MIKNAKEFGIEGNVHTMYDVDLMYPVAGRISMNYNRIRVESYSTYLKLLDIITRFQNVYHSNIKAIFDIESFYGGAISICC